ncbi:hypothetical protein OSB04_013158 [Centaurea solstitialis]|uniref:CCHC-type domain-containing protein n=1 Tax=Centaurea solstitialis TaxID=347529 RepID=A0AA38WQG2_9ASTR|nr:hypothetical protein OSB04_013158 [Centaurea solstitialis]
MVSTRRNPSSEEPETPDLRDVIGSQVTETLHQILPGLFAQMKDEILAAVDQRIDTTFTTHGSTSGSSSQAPGRAVTFKDFMACQPPHFEGRKDPIACFRWVAAVEGAFRTSGCPEGMKVFYAVNLLRNAGKEWWGLILKSRTEEQINAMTWDEFKVLLDEQFAPRIEKQRITSEFLNLAQTTETVNEITDQFLEKLLFCPDYVSTEEMKMFRYQGVLKPEIREFVATAMCKTFNDMVDVARTRELFLEEQQQGKRKAEQEPVPVKKSKGQRSDIRKEFSGCPKCGKNHSGECRLPEPVCFKCGKPGHRSRECRVEPRTCFHCFQPGHIKPNCPQLVGAAAAATPAPTPLMITDGSTGKKSGSTTGGRGRVFQLTAGEAEADPDMVADCAEQLVRIHNPSGGELIAYGEGGGGSWRGRAPELHREAGCGARAECENMRIKEIVIVKVQWQYRKGFEWTWDPEADVRERGIRNSSQVDFRDEILVLVWARIRARLQRDSEFDDPTALDFMRY